MGFRFASNFRVLWSKESGSHRNSRLQSWLPTRKRGSSFSLNPPLYLFTGLYKKKEDGTTRRFSAVSCFSSEFLRNFVKQDSSGSSLSLLRRTTSEAVFFSGELLFAEIKTMFAFRGKWVLSKRPHPVKSFSRSILKRGLLNPPEFDRDSFWSKAFTYY